MTIPSFLIVATSQAAPNALSAIIVMAGEPPRLRVRLLEEAGAIERHVAFLNAAKAGKGPTAFTRVGLKGQDAETVDRFTNAVRQLPEVAGCHLMAGDCDFPNIGSSRLII